MSITGDVIDALGALRAYKGKLPSREEGRVLPAIVVQAITGSDELDLMSDPGPFRRLVQLDAWATTESGADAYMEQAKAAMRAATTFRVDSIDLSGAPPWDDDAKLWRSSYEFGVIW